MVLTVPVLIQDGMFIDGVLYSAVSHNLANGIGSFWFPSFSFNNMAGIHNSFHEQPPLIFGIQSLFYKLLGSSMYVERFYTVLMLFLNIWLIKKVWELIFTIETKLSEFSWLPVLLWITIPVCFWSFTHNMHENTVSVFTLSAIFFLIKAIQLQKANALVLNLILSSLFIFLASFSKGVPGLFPIAAPLAFVVGKKISLKKAFALSAWLLLSVAAVYGLILFNHEARESLNNYVFLRLLKRIQDVPTTGNYLDTLFRLFFECLPMISIAILLKWRLKNRVLLSRENNPVAFQFIIIGLMGVMPLMLTLVQKGFYMLPALPFIAIGFSVFIISEIQFLTHNLDGNALFKKVFSVFSALIFVLAIILSIFNVGKFSRNESLLKDIHTLGKLIPKHSVINCTYDLQRDWSLQTYLSRYYFISLDTNNPHSYYLADKTEFETFDSTQFNDFDVLENRLNHFILLKKKN
jgi:hypothetical protein